MNRPCLRPDPGADLTSGLGALGRRRAGSSVELEVVTVLDEPSRSLRVNPVEVTSVTVPATVGTRTTIMVTANVPSAFFFWTRLTCHRR